MNIYFIRHGDPDYSTDSLTNLGKIQAEKLADSIKNLEIDEVYQSPMGRAKQTAAYSCKNWNIEPVTVQWLKEIEWGNKSGDAYSTSSPWSIKERLITSRNLYPENGSWNKIDEIKNDRILEDNKKHCQDFDAFLEQQGYKRNGNLYEAVSPNDKDIVFFCHGGVSSTLISHLLNMDFWQFICHVGLTVTSVSKISFNAKKGQCFAPTLSYLNDSHHLN